MMSRLFTIWRPHVPESIDGLPLVTKVSEFFTNFPYHRLPDRPILAFCLRPEIAFGLVVFYLLSDKPVAMFRDAIRLDPKSNSFRNCIAVHNLLLGIFSAVCAWNSYPVVVSHLMKYGAFDTYCDPNGTLWHEGLGAWSTIFYLSKYYEFLDTWVLVLKGKQASFLQVYHHAGIVLTMYGGVVSQSAWLQVVVLLNSGTSSALSLSNLCQWRCPANIFHRRHSLFDFPPPSHPHVHVHLFSYQNTGAQSRNQECQILDHGADWSVHYWHLEYTGSSHHG